MMQGSRYWLDFILGRKLAGVIVEVESYIGPDDKGSHAYLNKRIERTEIRWRYFIKDNPYVSKVAGKYIKQEIIAWWKIW